MKQHLMASWLVLCLTAVSWADFESPAAPPNMPTDQAQRPWDVTIRAFAGYNDNVNVVPNITTFMGETHSTYVGLTFDGNYRLLQDADWTAGAALHVDRLQYFNHQAVPSPIVNDDADEYDLFVVQPAIYLQRRFTLAGRPASVDMSYNFRYEELDVIDSGGVDSHTLAWAFGINPCLSCPNFWVGTKYTLGFHDFEVDLATTGMLQRSGVSNSVDVMAQYSWDQGMRKVLATYTYLNFDADSRDFEHDGHGIKLRFESHVYGPLWVALDFGYRYAGYAGGSTFTPPRTRQEVFDYGLTFVYVINRNWSVDIYYSHEDIESNSGAFETDINNIGLGVTLRF